MIFDDLRVDNAFRLDLEVDDEVFVEIKATDIKPIHEAPKPQVAAPHDLGGLWTLGSGLWLCGDLRISAFHTIGVPCEVAVAVGGRPANRFLPRAQGPEPRALAT